MIGIKMKKPGIVAAWLVLASAASWASACNRSEANELSDRTPPDEVWLSQEQMAKGNIRVAEAMEQDFPKPSRWEEESPSTTCWFSMCFRP